MLSDLDNIGYTTQSFVVPAAAVNAPHRRDRVFIVGFLSDTHSIGHEGIKRLYQDIGTFRTRGTSAFGSTSKLFDDIDWKERAEQSCFLGRDDGL
ncbi:DNA cytosine methyltransferase [Paenibacillus shunpengii]|uniref:DNA cytosine methyltransferase n=1 Tax=Paenibacillus shunpengii TaxID=2054424 RepID=A0ABW5SVR4_9BACL